MTTSAAIGYSTTFGIKNGGGTFDNVAEVTSVKPPGYSRDAIDATHMESPDRFREYIAGMMDAGEVTIGLNYVPAASDAVLTALTAGKGDFKITLPNGVTVTFSAVVTAYDIDAPLDDKMTATATFKVSGKPVLA
jgi:predicted secreted protein